MTESSNVIYKRKIMRELCADPDIFTLIDDTSLSSEEPEGMIGRDIFPMVKVPGTTQVTQNYICISVDTPRLSEGNDFWEDKLITFVVACQEQNVLLSKYGAARHDLIAACITEHFNWSNILGFELKLISDEEETWSQGYYVRLLKYRNYALNSIRNANKINRR